MAKRGQLLVNMIAASFGTGILSMPWGTAGASLIPALLIVFAVAVFMVFTISLLIDAGERHQKADLGNLLGALPGSAGWMVPLFVNVSLWITMWLTLVGYEITIADALEVVFPGYRVAIVIVSSAVILPLCFLDMSRLSFTSTLSLLVVGNLFMITSTTLVQQGLSHSLPSDICFYGVDDGLISMASMSCTSMIVQMCALQMYAELEDKTPKKFAHITRVCFIVLFFIYAGFAAIGYLTYGPDVKSNILKNLPNNVWGKASRIAYVVVIGAAYPIMVYPMISSIKNSDALQGRGTNITWACNIGTVVIVVSAMFVATILDNLGTINALVGAVQCAVFVGVCPGLVGLFMSGERSESLPWKSSMIVLIVVCCLLGILGCIFPNNYAAALEKTCVWVGTSSSFQASSPDNLTFS